MRTFHIGLTSISFFVVYETVSEFLKANFDKSKNTYF